MVFHDNKIIHLKMKNSFLQSQSIVLENASNIMTSRAPHFRGSSKILSHNKKIPQTSSTKPVYFWRLELKGYCRIPH